MLFVWFTSLTAAAFVLWTLFRIYRYCDDRRILRQVPGFTPGVSPTSLLGAILPTNRINPGMCWSWRRKTAYYNWTRDIIAFVPFLVSDPVYYCSSPEVFKQIWGNESRLEMHKPWDLTLGPVFGDSIASSSGEIWRRHRRIVVPAFNAQAYDSAWQVTQDAFRQMVETEGWSGRREIAIIKPHALVLKLTLMVISKTAFGFSVSWTPSDDPEFRFMNDLDTVSSSLIRRMVYPDWVYRLPSIQLQKMQRAWNSVSKYIADAMDSAKLMQRESGSEDLKRMDLLNRIVAASLSEGDKLKISNQEMIGNMYSLLFAGFETSASGLITTLFYLALYPEEQAKAADEIEQARADKALTPDTLPFTLACFWEALRLCPPTLMIPRVLDQDTPVTVSFPNKESIVLAKGCTIVGDFLAMMRNPNYFPDPTIFRPTRWENVPERDFLSFGYGPRACVGRKFAQAEVLSLLSSILTEYTVLPHLAEGETQRGYEQRVLKSAAFVGTSHFLTDVPLIFSRK